MKSLIIYLHIYTHKYTHMQSGRKNISFGTWQEASWKGNQKLLGNVK